MSVNMRRANYADMYGLTTGDKVRLGDTELFIEIEKEYTFMAIKPSLVEVKPFVMEWHNPLQQSILKKC